LQKALARAGYGSRRSIEDLIRAGRIRIGDRVARLGDRIDERRDRVLLDDTPVALHPELRYFALHKPAGVTSTLRDVHAARTLQPLLPPGPHVLPVGRLDRDSEGLLLLTNDGDLANRLQHPRYGVEKEYVAEVDGALPRATIRALTAGVVLEDGPARAIRASLVDAGPKRSAVSVVMTEGRKREVRRMLAAVGYPVRRLVRVRVGPVRLRDLAPGKTRPLAPDEIAELYRLSGLQRAAPNLQRRAQRRSR
jgi:23S rRNA pseudouridine2605 synthase